MCARLVLLTRGTSADIFFRPFSEARPPEVSFQEVDGAVSSWMSSGWGIMISAENLSFERFVRWNHYLSISCVQPFLVLYDFSGAFPVLHQGAVAVLGLLQFLEETFPRGVRCSYENLGGEERQIRIVVFSFVC